MPTVAAKHLWTVIAQKTIKEVKWIIFILKYTVKTNKQTKTKLTNGGEATERRTNWKSVKKMADLSPTVWIILLDKNYLINHVKEIVWLE